jgi:hypothetical protein
MFSLDYCYYPGFIRICATGNIEKGSSNSQETPFWETGLAVIPSARISGFHFFMGVFPPES